MGDSHHSAGGGEIIMNEKDFTTFLKRGGRSKSALNRILTLVKAFEQFLKDKRDTNLDEAGPEDLKDYVNYVEQDKKSAKTHLWAIQYYYEFTNNNDMKEVTGVLRGQRMTKKPFQLKNFKGVNCEHVNILQERGIDTVDQMVTAGKTPEERQRLAQESGVSVEGIVELVKLSDLARIPGLKSVRARLYYDAGVDTVEKIAAWDPEELREMLIEFVERTAFDGIAPLPKEAASAVKTAKKLPKIIVY